MQNKELKKNSNPLKRCPFCDGEAFIYYSGSQFQFGEVVCKDCKSHSDRKRVDEAVEVWNTRVPMQKIVKRLEENIVDNVDCYTGEPCNNPCVDCMNTTFYKALEIVTEEGGLND